MVPISKRTVSIAIFGVSESSERRIELTNARSVSVSRILIFSSLSSITFVFTMVSPQTRRPLRPPLAFVPSVAIGVTSSIRVICTPARVRALIAAVAPGAL